MTKLQFLNEYETNLKPFLKKGDIVKISKLAKVAYKKCRSAIYGQTSDPATLEKVLYATKLIARKNKRQLPTSNI